ncbi:MAG: hypothetical protein ACO4AZ_11570, partial [Ilumatobacteraceae bacterium]
MNVGGELTGETVGTATSTASAGVATFTNLGLGGRSGIAYTMSYGATLNGVAHQAATQSVTPTPGTATTVSIQVSADGAVVGQPFNVQPRVVILDEYGNTVPSSGQVVTATISSGATLIGTTSRSTNANGIAIFSNLGIRGTSGTVYTLSFALDGYQATTQSIPVNAGAAARLALTSESSGIAAGSAFTTQPQVQVKDADGNLVTTSTATVTATITQVDGVGSLVGTTSVSAVNGVASFTNLGIDGRAGTAYRITYSALGLTSTSEFLTVSIGAPVSIEFIDQSVGTASGAAFTRQPRLVVKDASGNVVTGYVTPVTATVTLANGNVGGSL